MINDNNKLLNILQNILNILPYLLIILSIIGIGIVFFCFNENVLINASFILIPTIIGSACVIYIKKQSIINNKDLELENCDVKKTESSTKTSISNTIKIQVIFLLFGYVLAILNYSATALYYVILLVLFSNLAFQIGTKSCKLGIFIVELFFSLLLLLCPPFFTGLYLGPDMGYHLTIINQIINDGLLLFNSQSSMYDALYINYTNYQLFHVIFVICSIITGLDAHTSLIVFFSVIHCFMIFVSIGIIKNLTGNNIYCLLATLLLALLYYFNLPLVFFAPYGFENYYILLFIFLLILSSVKQDSKNQLLTLSIIIMIAIMMTHHLQQFAGLILLCLIFGIDRLTGYIIHKPATLEIRYLIIYISFFIGYATFNTLSLVMNYTKDTIFTQSIEINTNIDTLNMDGFSLYDFFSHFGQSLVILFGLIGGIIVLLVTIRNIINTKNTTKYRNLLFIGLFSLILLYVFVVGPLDIVPIFKSLQLSRYRFLFAPFIAITLSTGILFLLSCLSFRKKSIKTILIIGIILLFLIPITITFETTNEIVTGENYLNIDISTTIYKMNLQTSEVILENQITKNLPQDSKLYIYAESGDSFYSQARLIHSNTQYKIIFKEINDTSVLPTTVYCALDINEKGNQIIASSLNNQFYEKLYNNGSLLLIYMIKTSG